MPIFREHIKSCKNFNVPEEICEEVNKEMDEPSQWIPGCKHRKFRHQLNDCNSIAQTLTLKVLIESKSKVEASKIFDQAILACKVHIKDDCEEGKEVCKRSLPCR